MKNGFDFRWFHGPFPYVLYTMKISKLNVKNLCTYVCYSKTRFSDLCLFTTLPEGLVKELKEHRDMESKIQERQINCKKSHNTQHTSRLIEEL